MNSPSMSAVFSWHVRIKPTLCHREVIESPLLFEMVSLKMLKKVSETDQILRQDGCGSSIYAPGTSSILLAHTSAFWNHSSSFIVLLRHKFTDPQLLHSHYGD
jgi:hypothetical protein